MRGIAALLAVTLAFPAWAQTYPSPTFQSTTTLGPATMNGGGSLGGTWSGNPTFSGSPVFNKTVGVGKAAGGEVQVYDNGTFTPNFTAGTALNVPTFSDLRSFQPDALVRTGTVITEGFAVRGDGGGATYDWDSTNTCASDGNNMICVLPRGTAHTTTGRWRLRMPGGVVDARVGGLKCDGTTDDAAALNTLINYLFQIGGGTVVLPATNAGAVSGCVISGADLAMNKGVALRGAVNPFPGPTAFTEYASSTILLSPAHTINMSDGSTLSDVLVWRQGLAAKPNNPADVFAAVASWQDGSVAVSKLNGSVERVRVVGFNTAFKMTFGGSNHWLRDVQFDGINGLDRGGANAVTYVDNFQANSFWAAGMGARDGVHDATPTAGTGYTTGDVVTATGGACTVSPTFTVTASGGVPSALAVLNVGDCNGSNLPNGNTFTGGTGTGLKATINFSSSGYRPGIAIYEHDGVGLTVSKGLFEQYQTAIKIVNSSLVTITHVTIEGPGGQQNWSQPIGVDTEACSEASFVDNAVTANWTNWKLYAATDQTAATCNTSGGNVNIAGVSKIYGGSTNGAATDTTIDVGPGATVFVSGLRISSGINSAHPNVKVGANAQFTASGLVLNPTSMKAPSWLTADPTASLNICGAVSYGPNPLSSIGYWETCLQQQAPLTKTGTAYTLISSDQALTLNPSATFTLTLPAAASFPGRLLTLRNIAAFAVNSAASNVVPISSATAGTAILAATAGKWANLQSDGTNWIVMSAN